MTSATAHQRRLALAGNGSTVDLVVPVTGTIDQALRGAGVDLDVTKHAILTRSGRELDPGSAVSDLQDGALLSIVDLTQAPHPPVSARSDTTAPAHDSPWWILSTAAAIILALALFRLASGGTLWPDAWRLLGAAGLGLGALASATTWIVRDSLRDRPAPALAAILVLTAAAAATGTPAVHGAVHLAVAAALLSITVTTTLMAVAAPGQLQRGLVSATSAVAMTLTAVWGGTLLAGWPLSSAAALTLGLVAPGLRLIPSLLLNVQEGYAINYQHFMSQRWTVRGAVPASPGEPTMDLVRPLVEESTARLTAGVVSLTVAAVMVTPSVVAGIHDPHLMVRIGSIGAIALTVVALVLSPRNRTSWALRWSPRAGASLMILAVTLDPTLRTSDTAAAVIAGVALLIGLAAASLIVPLAKGARSLVWSRLGDLLDWLAAALSLPMALLAANVLETVRTMMAR